MIISITIVANGTNFAIDTNAFSLGAYNKLVALAVEYPSEQVTLTSYDVSLGCLSIQHYPASWTAQPTPVDFAKAITDVNKLLG